MLSVLFYEKNTWKKASIHSWVTLERYLTADAKGWLKIESLAGRVSYEELNLFFNTLRDTVILQITSDRGLSHSTAYKIPKDLLDDVIPKIIKNAKRTL